MIHVFQDDGTLETAALLDRCYRYRHRLFVERLGWEALRKPDGREIDQFDGPDAIHVAGVESERIVCYSRFLPTTGPHLLSDLYPDLLDGDPVPRGPGIYEWTRGSVVPERQDGASAYSMPARELYLGVLEWGLAGGVEGFTIEFDPFLITRMLQLDYEVRPLALPKMIDGRMVVPAYIGFTEQTLETCREFFGIQHSVLAQARPEEVLSPDWRTFGLDGAFGAIH